MRQGYSGGGEAGGSATGFEPAGLSGVTAIAVNTVRHDMVTARRPATVNLPGETPMRYRQTRRLMAATLILAGAAALPVLAGGTILTGKDIESRIAATAIKVRTGPDYEFPVTITLMPDGTIEGVSANGYIDAGRWWTRGDTLCHQWASWFDGTRKCHAVQAEGDTLTLTRPDASTFESTSMKLRK